VVPPGRGGGLAVLEDEMGGYIGRRLLLLILGEEKGEAGFAGVVVVVVGVGEGGRGIGRGGCGGGGSVEGRAGGGGRGWSIRSERRRKGRGGRIVDGERERKGNELAELLLEAKGTNGTWVVSERVVGALHFFGGNMSHTTALVNQTTAVVCPFYCGSTIAVVASIPFTAILEPQL